MKRLAAALLILSASCILASAEDTDVLFREDFADMTNWPPLLFPKIASHTKYSIVTEGTNSILKAECNASASGLIYTNTFDIYKYPKVKWRWKTENVFKKGNARKKKGDDYPIRVYVIFTYNPAKAGLGLRTKYNLAKAVYGKYPPHSSLNYIWSNRRHKKDHLKSPYTGRSIMIPIQAGDTETGKWIVNDVNVQEDYKKVFGENPPTEASLAIMSDSDNTGEAATAYIDYIEVYR